MSLSGRRRISEAKKGKPGHPHSEESRIKMSEAKKAYWLKKKEMLIDGKGEQTR
jgi:hypothetical protein